ncbi:MAG: metallophosphoesterase family protein [Pseudomonadota bacterium]
MLRIGVISDTHGLLRPEALAQLQGSDYLIHGGDIGNPEILAQLAAIAPLTVVRGNNDNAPWAQGIADTARLDLDEVSIYVLHNLATLDLDPFAAGIQVIISGHSHCPTKQFRSGILYLNPGSAGPRRFKLPVSVAEILVDGASVTARIIELEL